MRRLAAIPVALLAFAACSNEPDIVYVAVPTTAPVRDRDVQILELIWPSFRGEVCPTLRAAGGLTPQMERIAIENFNKGAGEPLSAAGETRLIELLKEC